MSKRLGLILLALLFFSLGSYLAFYKNNPKESLLLESSLTQCFKNSSRSECYQKLAKNLLEDRPLSEALLQVNSSLNGGVLSECHSLTHFMGREAYTQDPDFGRTFRECRGGCLGGCYHGVVEQYLKDQDISLTDESSSQKVVSDICSTQGKSGLYQDCLHGLGHALMFVSSNNLPASLTLCDKIPEAQACYVGVFMENSSSLTNFDHPSTFLRANDPLYPCNSLEEKYLEACYTTQSNYFLNLTNFDWDQTISLCLSVPRPYQGGCFNYLGGNLVFYLDNFEIVTVTCNKIPIGLQKDCFMGAVETLRDQDTSKLSQFCSLPEIKQQGYCTTLK